jgi:hypothetical protein
MLGVSRSYAAALCTDPDGSKDRARKDSYRGTCETCGTRTDGSNGRQNAPRYCAHCAPGSPEARAAKTIWSPERIIEAIQEWVVIYGEPPAINDWSPYGARDDGDEWRAIRFENDLRWPWFTSVVVRFGSWNAAIRAAGFEPRAGHGGAGNEKRRRSARLAA